MSLRSGTISAPPLRPELERRAHGVFKENAGAWGGFYYWKSKNENRAKYAQRFLNKFADKYGADAALRATEIVLKD